MVCYYVSISFHSIISKSSFSCYLKMKFPNSARRFYYIINIINFKTLITVLFIGQVTQFFFTFSLYKLSLPIM